jgi:hypothetical protein
MIWIFSILGDRAANVDITWYHWPCNIDITKNRFYMAARIDKIVISELAATDLQSCWWAFSGKRRASERAPLLRSTAGDIFGMYLANMLFGEF